MINPRPNVRSTGFGKSAQTQGDRLLNKNGRLNVKRKGQFFFDGYSPYHYLITINWWKFNVIMFAAFILGNLLFTALYTLAGFDELQGFYHTTYLGKLFEVFIFSAQTMTTVGYGRINPVGVSASLISTFETLTGLMNFAILTGLVYGRFSKPKVRLIYSPKALLAPFQEGRALMFRIANALNNQLLECEASLLFSYIDPSTNGRRFVSLDLEYSKVSALALSWTIVHPIDAGSPLNNTTIQELISLRAEFLFSFKAFDDTYSQVVHTRHSYVAEELVDGARFTSMYYRADDGSSTILDISKVGAYEPETTPVRQSVS